MKCQINFANAKRISLFSVILSVMALYAWLPNANAAGSFKKVTLTLSSASPPSMEDSRALKIMSHQISKQTGGAVKLKLYLSSQLFNEVQGIKAANVGNVDMSIACTCNFTALTSVFKFADIPYIFKSTESARKVWDGSIGKEISKKFDAATNMRVLAYTPSGGGARLIFNSRHQVKVPKDLHGLKIRTTATSIEQDLFKAWGAQPTFVDVSDLYSALQQHVVDGYHIQPWWAWTLKLYETTPYATDVNAEYVYRALVINKNSWQKLSAKEQKIFSSDIKQYEKNAYKFDQQERTKGFRLLRKHGVKIYEPTQAQLHKWRTEALTIRSLPPVTKSVPKPMIHKVEEAQK